MTSTKRGSLDSNQKGVGSGEMIRGSGVRWDRTINLRVLGPGALPIELPLQKSRPAVMGSWKGTLNGWPTLDYLISIHSVEAR